MAKITFNPESGIQSLSGSLGRLTFRTINGQTYVNERPMPVLPKKATREQRRKYHRQMIIDSCLEILQNGMEDIQEAMRIRPKIKDRLEYLYKKFSPTIKARTKLQKAIMSEYYARFNTEKTSIKQGNNPDKNRKHEKDI